MCHQNSKIRCCHNQTSMNKTYKIALKRKVTNVTRNCKIVHAQVIKRRTKNERDIFHLLATIAAAQFPLPGDFKVILFLARSF